MLPAKDLHILLQIPNNYNLQISTLQTSLLYSFPFCSSSPVYKILDQYLSKQQLKIVTMLRRLLVKVVGAVFQQDLGKGRRVCKQTCASVRCLKQAQRQQKCSDERKEFLHPFFTRP